MPISQADLNSKLKQLTGSFDTKSLTDQLSNISTKAKAADLTEMGKKLGDVKGGFAGLGQNVDNLTEDLAGQLDANGFPSGGINTATINRIDKSIQSSIPALATDISTQSGSISALVSSAHGASESLKSSAAPAALAIEEAANGLMQDIVADGSPEAIAGTLKAVADVSPADIKNLLQEVANVDVKNIVDIATADILGFKLPGDFGDILDLANDKLSKVLGGLNGANMLKGAVESFTGEIQNAITGVVEDLNAFGSIGDLKTLTNKVIDGKGLEVANELVKQVKIPADLQKELDTVGIPSPTFNKLEDLQGFVDTSKNLGLTSSGLVKVEKTLTSLNNDIANRDTSLSSSISSGGSATNPVVDPITYEEGTFPFLNSEEEIVRYLQGATREITTVVWHWTANYTDQGYIGSEQINDQHVNGRGWSAIGYHFIVKRDGSIQIGRNINKIGSHVGGFNTNSIGISFVAGYKCTSTKYSGIPPYSEVGEESITIAQHESFKRFMSAWYRVFPGGNAWGHADFPRNKGKVDPGFDVSKRVYEMFGKKNVGHPKKDDKLLSRTEISEKRQFGTEVA